MLRFGCNNIFRKVLIKYLPGDQRKRLIKQMTSAHLLPPKTNKKPEWTHVSVLTSRVQILFQIQNSKSYRVLTFPLRAVSGACVQRISNRALLH